MKCTGRSVTHNEVRVERHLRVGEKDGLPTGKPQAGAAANVVSGVRSNEELARALRTGLAQLGVTPQSLSILIQR